MPAAKLLNIFALSTLAVLLCSFAPSQTLALSIRADHLPRQIPNHHGIAKKKKRGLNKRCKPNPSSSSSPPVQGTPAPAPGPVDANLNADNVTPSSSSQLSAATNPPTSISSGPGKLAVAWAMGNDPRLTDIVSTHRVKMIHLWDSEIPDAVKNTGVPVSIMLWSNSQDRVDKFVQFAKPGYASHAYGFNEVNQDGQANMPVAAGVSAWYQYIRPLADQGYTLGSPCTTSAPNGFDWMTEFFNQCGADCHVDEVAIHWYDVHFEDLKAYIDKWAGFGKPMRLTEFACQNFNDLNAQPSMDDIWTFTDQAIQYLEGDQRMMSYAPFGFMTDMSNVVPYNTLFSSDGLSPLGWKYVNGY